MTMTPEAARTAVSNSLLQIVPDADFEALDDEADLRDALELDSLDFLAFVEQLSKRTGLPIAEEDYSRLQTMSRCLTFLTEAA